MIDIILIHLYLIMVSQSGNLNIKLIVDINHSALC